MSKVIVVLKTLGDRPEMLEQAVAAWANVADTELRVISGPEPMGVGIDRAYQDIADDEIGVTAADDLVPMFTNLEEVLQMYARCEQAVPRYLNRDGGPWAPYDGNPDGSPASWTRLPIASGRLYRELGSVLPTTSYFDFDYSARLSEAGWKLRLCHAFTFTHLDGPHTWETEEVHARESALWERASRLLAARERARL